LEVEIKGSYARLVRIFDEDVSREDLLDGCRWHYNRNVQLSKRQPYAVTREPSWPMKGLPIVAVGTHNGQELVMFGVCQSTAWENPNPEYVFGDEYHSQIDVRWEHRVYRVLKGDRPTKPGMSNSKLTRPEYVAWRNAAEPVLDLAA
jgi:hypothetical protein